MAVFLIVLYLVFVCLIGGCGGMLMHKKAPHDAERLGEGELCGLALWVSSVVMSGKYELRCTKYEFGKSGGRCPRGCLGSCGGVCGAI